MMRGRPSNRSRRSDRFSESVEVLRVSIWWLGWDQLEDAEVWQKIIEYRPDASEHDLQISQNDLGILSIYYIPNLLYNIGLSLLAYISGTTSGHHHSLRRMRYQIRTLFWTGFREYLVTRKIGPLLCMPLQSPYSTRLVVQTTGNGCAGCHLCFSPSYRRYLRC